MSCQFRVKYNIQQLQTKSNPIFTHIKAYLISNNTKRLVSKAKQLINNHAYFKTVFQQNGKIININPLTGSYDQSKVQFIFQFEAQQKFIKMGEIFVDLADIINNNKQGQLLNYKLEKCYDRNAKVLIAVEIIPQQNKRLNRSTEIRHKQQELHIQSHHNLPQTKTRVNSLYEKNNYTQCSVLQNFVLRQDLSLISQNKTSYNPNRIQFQRYTTGKTQVLKKASQNKEEIEKLRENLTRADTNLRLIQNQLSAVEQKYLLNSKKLLQTEHILKGTLKENTKLQKMCQKLQFQLNTLQKNSNSQKQQQGHETQKYLKMFQQSQNLRNKLLIEIENERKQIREKMKQVQRRTEENLKNTKNVKKQQQILKEDLKQCMSEIAKLERQLKQQKSFKLKKDQQVQKTQIQIKQLNESLSLKQQELQQIKQQKIQLVQELQISKLTINQLQCEKKNIKIQAQQRLKTIQQYEVQLSKSNQVLKSERLNYSRHLQEIQQYKERQQKNFEKYIEELQTKTINDSNKNNQNRQLKRDISKINKWLEEERQRNNLLQAQLQKLSKEKQLLERKVIKQQNQIMLLQNQKGQIQKLLIRLRQQKQELKLQNRQQDQSLIQIQNEELIEKSYAERDQIWKNQLEKVEQDTKLMIEKHKKQKQTLIAKSKTSQKQLSQLKKELESYKNRIIHLEKLDANTQRSTKQSLLKISKLQQKLTQNENIIAQKQIKITQLQNKNEVNHQVKSCLVEHQQKILAKTKQVANIKTQLEKQRDLRNKYRIQIKQLLVAISNIISKSQKQHIFHNQLRYDYLQPETLLLINTTLKVYIDKHNRIRIKLQKAQELKSELDQKDKKLQQTSNGPKFQRKFSNSSKNSSHYLGEDEDVYNYNKFNDSRTINLLQKKEQEQVLINLTKQELAQNTKKLVKQKERNLEMERQIERLQKNTEDLRRQLMKTKQILQSRSEELEIEVANSLKKQKSITIAKEEIRNITFQLETSKNKIQIMQKMQKDQKVRKNSNSKLSQPKIQDQYFLKFMDIEKQLKQSQQELQKSKRQKYQTKKDEGQFNKQLKSLQLKLRQHENTINNMKKQLEQQRKNAEQQKEIYNARIKKLKQNYEEQLQNHIKQKKQLKQNFENQEQKSKQLTRKNRILDQNVNKLKSDLSLNSDKQEKNRKALIAQYNLKIKGIQTQHQNELSIMKRQMEDQKMIEKSLKQITQKKQKQIRQLKEEVDLKIKEIENLLGQCQIYGIRIKSLEEQQSLYKQTIEVLEKKIYESSESSKKNTHKQYENSELKQNFSLKAFSFQ